MGEHGWLRARVTYVERERGWGNMGGYVLESHMLREREDGGTWVAMC